MNALSRTLAAAAVTAVVALGVTGCNNRSDRAILVTARVDTVNPANGPVTGGTLVTITGANFDFGTTAVLFDGVAGFDVNVINGNTLTVRTPLKLDGTAETVDIIVASNFGSGDSIDAFTFDAVVLNPTIGGSGGGTVVEIPGAGFNAGGQPIVLFGADQAANVAVISDVLVRATTPAVANNGAVDVTFINRFGRVDLPNAFDFDVAVESVVPDLASDAGNTVITIVTNGFNEDFTVTLPAVEFGGTPAAAVLAVAANELDVTVPAGLAVGALDIDVIGANDTATFAGFESVAAVTVGDVVINEFYANVNTGSLEDPNNDGVSDETDDEYIEIVNLTGGPIDLSDFVIQDQLAAVTDRHVFPNPTTIPTDGCIVIFGGGNPTGFGNLHEDAHAQTASTGTLGLNNGGDGINLLDINGVLVEEATYGAGVPDAASQNRDPDGQFNADPTAFVDHDVANNFNGNFFSPGLRVDQTPFP